MRTSHASIKLSLAFAAAVALGVAAGNAGRLVPSAQAEPGARPCSIASERGNWGYSYSGTIDGVGPIVGVGTETCDGAGHCTGTDTAVVFGQTVTHTFTTVETINPDCSGGSEITYDDGTVVHSKFVIVAGETELHFTGADPGASLSGVQKRR
jgi:hypothetical protein